MTQWPFSLVTLGLVVVLLQRGVALQIRGTENGVRLERLAPVEGEQGQK